MQTILDKFAGRERLLGLAVYDNEGALFATSLDLPSDLAQIHVIPEKAMDADDIKSDFVDFNKKNIYAFATPLHSDENVIGALMVFQKADYIRAEIGQIWKTNLLRLFLQALLLSLAIAIFLNGLFINQYCVLLKMFAQFAAENLMVILKRKKSWFFKTDRN